MHKSSWLLLLVVVILAKIFFLGWVLSFVLFAVGASLIFVLDVVRDMIRPGSVGGMGSSELEHQVEEEAD